MKKILVVAPHPDDETLGCGGTLLKHKREGDDVSWLIVTKMDKKYGWKDDAIEKRNKEIESVSKKFEFNKVVQLDFPAAHLDEISQANLIEVFNQEIDKITPEIIYLPFHHDAHGDHRLVFHAAYSCLKSFRSPYAKQILMYETLSETEMSEGSSGNSFCPNVFVDISETLETKIEILSLYASEIDSHPFPRSADNCRALATFRGATAGFTYAESFMLIRELR